MGIKGLWSVLAPYSEKKALHEIRGETIAVDLSGWVCDSQNVTDYHIQPKLYLRNLFFRTIYLILADINPVFVLEGDAPELKRDVMASRNAIQFRGAAPRSDTAIANNANKKPDVGRKRFRNVLKECESLLKRMGVRCVKGSGEAEATCAQLNAQGLVDAVVSQDSDCFAYGAKRVYRNFSVSSAAGGGAMQGSVDCYDADIMLQSNGFGRNKMVALAILCGCDYGVGACGSSINTAVAFLHTVPDDEIIGRLIAWVSNTDHYEERSRFASAPGRCDRCGHVGRTHAKNGCPVCATHKSCQDNGHKAKVAELKKELSLRSRALSSGMLFPEPKVMKEFLNRPADEIDLDSLKYPAPSLIQFVKLMSSKLDWSERYCVAKFLPLLTKWHLQDNVPSRTIKPILIKKKRSPRGVPSYEVVWSDTEGQYEALIPDDQFEDDEDPTIAWTTIERQDLMQKYYTEVVDIYEESIKKPPKEKKSRGRKKKDNDDTAKPKRKYTKKIKQIDVDIANISSSMTNLDLAFKKQYDLSKLNVSVKVNKLKRKIKKGQKTIDSFIAQKKRKSNKNSLRYGFEDIAIEDGFNQPAHINEKNNCINNLPENSLRDSFKDLSIHNNDLMTSFIDNKENNKHLLSMLNMDDDGEINESDLSDIIDNIVSRAPVATTAKVERKIMNLVFERNSTPRKSLRKSVLNNIHKNCSTPKGSPVRKSCRISNISNAKTNYCDVNTSYFFDKLTECDAFEMSVEHNSVINLDCDTTVDYSLPDVQL